MDKYIFYLRLSKITAKDYLSKPEGVSKEGFKKQFDSAGLSTQRRICENLVISKKGRIIKEFKEIESARKSRPILQEAINECILLQCNLVVANTDRLARDLLSSLLIVKNIENHGLEIFFADNPNMDKMSFVFNAYQAEREWTKMSEKERAAFETCKKTGKTKTGNWWGNPNFKNKEFHDKMYKFKVEGARVKKEKALNNPHNKRAYAYIKMCWSSGQRNYVEIATQMSESGYKTSRGSKMHPKAVKRILDMYN